MEIFGLPIPFTGGRKAISPVDSNRGWFPLIRESFSGAWQRNIELKAESILSFHAVFACQTLIASDIAKLRVKLVEDRDGIWTEVSRPAYSPVLRKPNHFQNRIQFFESWVLSKLQSGNTYALKGRDGRGVVTKLYILDPKLVRPMVSDDGSVFYELSTDNLSGVPTQIMVPAQEIIHDRFNTFFHPLVGISPIFANGLAATQGLSIQGNSTRLFQNGATAPGILTAPGHIDQETADRLKETWEDKYAGNNVGKIAVLGDNLKFERMALSSVDAQLIEQLKWSADVVCSTYHVPPYKVGLGQMPTHNNIQALNTEYYSQCLQKLIEDIEICLDEGLNTGEKLGTEFDIDGLLRMDSVTLMDVLEKSKSVETLDERRRRLNRPKITGGDTVYLQQQDHSIEAIAARDAQLIARANAPAEAEPEEPAPQIEDSIAMALVASRMKFADAPIKKVTA